MTSSDEDVNILTTCFCLVLISSRSGCSGLTSIEIDHRSIDQSISSYNSSIRVDYKVRSRVVSPVTSSDEGIFIFRGYYFSLKGQCGTV